VKWATSILIHFDRAASAWLIRRFIDPESSFVFLAPGAAAPQDATCFGIPGSAFPPYDGEATTFRKLLRAHELRDQALERVDGIIADGVGHFIHDADASGLSHRDRLLPGLVALTEGAMLLSGDDYEGLERVSIVFDALYARLVAGAALEAAGVDERPMDRALRLVHASGRLRATKEAFSAVAFGKVLG
jgi:hypothetical protein